MAKKHQTFISKFQSAWDNTSVDKRVGILFDIFPVTSFGNMANIHGNAHSSKFIYKHFSKENWPAEFWNSTIETIYSKLTS